MTALYTSSRPAEASNSERSMMGLRRVERMCAGTGLRRSGCAPRGFERRLMSRLFTLLLGFENPRSETTHAPSARFITLPAPMSVGVKPSARMVFAASRSSVSRGFFA